MQNKLLISCILLVSQLVSFNPQTYAYTATNQHKGILWKIEKSPAKPSYILGTVHSDDPRLLDLLNGVFTTLHKADSFTAEIKMDSTALHEASQVMFLPAGQTLESLIGQQRYRKCVELLARYSIPEQVVQKMKPWAVTVTLSMPNNRTGQVMDQRLYREAEITGKRTYGLETQREQMAIFESSSIRDQIIMLDDAIKEFDRLPFMFDEILHYYLQRDLSGLERVSSRYMQQSNSVIANSFKKRALIDRNYRMVRRMKPRLLEGNSFIAVGALHLAGEEGILRLLEKQGYKLTPVF